MSCRLFRRPTTGEPVRISSASTGESYGIGLISRWPSAPGRSIGGGIYPTQDTDDPEERAWLCLTIASPAAVTACTTHLADTKRDVAVAQCTYLFGTVIAAMRERDAVRVVLGADLNLGSADDPDLGSCLPAGLGGRRRRRRAARGGDPGFRRQRLQDDRLARHHRPPGAARDADAPLSAPGLMATTTASIVKCPGAGSICHTPAVGTPCGRDRPRRRRRVHSAAGM